MPRCFTCGITMVSYNAYHEHNVSAHSFRELSSTILRIQKFLDLILPFLQVTQFSSEIEKLLTFKEDSKKEGLQTDCMDEIIELGHNEGADNLTVQSLFLKSNLSPFPSQIIEVQENMWSQLAIQRLADKLNAAICHVDEDTLTTECLSSPKMSLFSLEDKKIADMIYSQIMKPKTSKIRGSQKHSPKISQEKSDAESLSIQTNFHDFSRHSSSKNIKPNVKVVLRSGRTLKKAQKDSNFIYFDEIGRNGDRGGSKNSKKSKLNLNPIQCSKNCEDLSKFKNSCSKNSSPKDESNIMMELFNGAKHTDWSMNEDELNISIEDLEMHSFEGIEGSFPDNQILTIESLLQELEGGGSIEVSNVIKENNLDSEMLVLDALMPSHEDTSAMLPSSQNSDSIMNCEPLSGNVSIDNIAPQFELSFDRGGCTSASANVSSSKSRGAKNLKECLLCQKTYKCKRRFEDHLKKYHMSTSWMKYKCTTCSKTFGFLSALERHIKQHDPSVEFICKVCGSQFKSLGKFKLHSAKHSKNETYTCEICNKVYYLKHSYRKHLKVHKEEKEMKCMLCDSIFYNKELYQRHLKKHEKKYLGQSNTLKCNKCSDVKSQPDSAANVDSARKLMPCLKCNKGFYKRFLIPNNTLVLSNNDTTKDKVRKKCLMCSKNVLNLKKHIRESHISNPYVNCEVCGLSVKKSSLSSHKFRKHEGGSVSCEHCNKTFKNILGLNEHIKRAHKEESKSM